jgi:hypothetical protein
VILVRKTENNKIYALKVIKKTKILERNQKEHVFSEKEILVSDGPNVGSVRAPLYREDGECFPQ